MAQICAPSTPQNPFSSRRSNKRLSFATFLKLSVVICLSYTLFAAYKFTPEDPQLETPAKDDNGANEALVGSPQEVQGSSETSSERKPAFAEIETVTNSDPHVVAYAVSFIKCGDYQSSAAGLVDASLILRHSIHKISSRNPSSGSKYDYKMYAIVHRQAEECSAKLKDVGFEIVIVDPPIQPSEIKGAYLKKTIHREWCCGHDEFIKLEAYTLPHEIIVHLDIDFAFYKPMDNLFDAILYNKDSEEGKRARSLIELERPGERLPDKIGAFITRDWGQVAPGKFPPAYQAGFLVARHDPRIMPEMLEIVKEGNYTEGWGSGHGWHGSGHGGYVGAMAMQGLVAYYYDHVNTENAVELNQCRHNHMGMDTLYRHEPNYTPRYVKKEYLGGCRNSLKHCEDCMNTDFDKIYSVHYTLCRKPWQCISRSNNKLPKDRGPQDSKYDIPSNTVSPPHCHELVRHWHDLRLDFENQLYSLTKDESILEGNSNDYKKDIFRGHCKAEGNSGYALISGKEESFKRVTELYDGSSLV